MASGYCTEQHRYRTFPPSLKVLLYSTGLEQKSGNFFCTELESKHIWLAGLLVFVTTVQFCLCNTKAAVDNTKMNECDCVKINFISKNRQPAHRL